MAKTADDRFWKNLFGNIHKGTPGKMAASEVGTLGLGAKALAGAKAAAPGFLGWYILNKILENRNQSKMQDIQMGAAREQAALQTPENLYYQAALPQAQADEEQARQALIASMSGGVVGPSLPKGYRVI